MAHSLQMQPLGHRGKGAETEGDVLLVVPRKRSVKAPGEREKGSVKTDIQGHL